MSIGIIVIIVFMLYFTMLQWIDQVVTSSILLNYQIATESATLYEQDTMQLNLMDLRIAKMYIERSLATKPWNPNFVNSTNKLVDIYTSTPSSYTFGADAVSFYARGI